MVKKSAITSTNLKILLVFTLIISFKIAFPSYATGQNSTASQTGDESGITPYIAVEEMPTYPGGNVALLKYIGKNIHYPAAAQRNGIQGKVIIKCCITPQGGISQLSVLKSADPDLDQEAMRVVKTITTFIPGKKGGVAVPVWFLIPITFSLKETN
jgi:TonB family protein